jgi:hypothetical protein
MKASSTYFDNSIREQNFFTEVISFESSTKPGNFIEIRSSYFVKAIDFSPEQS